MLDIKIHGTENPHCHVWNFISAMTLKEIDKDIFHIIFPWRFDKDVMRWYNVVHPCKIMNYDDLCKNFYINIHTMLAY